MPEEDYFGPMLAKQVLPQFDSALVGMNVATIAVQQSIVTFASNPEAEVIAENRTTGRRDHPFDGEAVARRGHLRRDEQHCLAREGNSRTLDNYKEQHRPVALDRQHMH